MVHSSCRMMSTEQVIYKFEFWSEEINNALKIWACDIKNLGIIDGFTFSYLSLPQDKVGVLTNA